ENRRMISILIPPILAYATIVNASVFSVKGTKTAGAVPRPSGSCCLSGAVIPQPAVGLTDDDDREKKGEHVGRRHRVQYAVQPEKHRKEQREPDAEHHLAHHGERR